METMANILETAMLICFGCSWPISAYHSWKAKTAKSTSLKFILLIMTGYIAGIASKVLKWVESGNFNYVIIVYILNILFVTANLVIYFRNKKLDSRM